MSRRFLEELHGTGSIYAAGELLRTTRYHLTVWAESGSSDPHDPARIEIEGHVDLTGMGEAVVLAGPADLALVLEDGRRLPFRLVGSSGRIIGTGGLEPAN
jgi:hypothetical protein